MLFFLFKKLRFIKFFGGTHLFSDFKNLPWYQIFNFIFLVLKIIICRQLAYTIVLIKNIFQTSNQISFILFFRLGKFSPIQNYCFTPHFSSLKRFLGPILYYFSDSRNFLGHRTHFPIQNFLLRFSLFSFFSNTFFLAFFH